MGNLKIFGTTWTDADGHLEPTTPQLIDTNDEVNSINRYSRYSGGRWTTTYSLSMSYPITETIKYLPSSTSEQVVKILVPKSLTVWFFYGTFSGGTINPQGDCSQTSAIIGNQALYTVTIPANKVCFVTQYIAGSSTSSTSNYYYGGLIPDDISNDGWIIKAPHKFNGTSWD